MPTASQKSKQELEQRYHEITELYDLAEELVGTVESEFIADPQAQLAIVEPLIEQLGESTDILTEEFITLAENPKKTNKTSKSRVEYALRKLYMAVDGYKKRVGASVRKNQDTLLNIADPIVEKLKRHVESVVAMFLEFVELSLDLIMNKAQVEQLKQNQVRVAMHLHQMSQQH